MSKLELLKEVVNEVDNGNSDSVGQIAEMLKEKGITNNMHLGKHKEIEGFFDNEEHVIEWFLGQYVNIIESESWFAMNSLINQSSRWLEGK